MEFLCHTFQYSVTRDDDYSAITNGTFSNLVTAEWLQNTNSYSQDAIPAGGKSIANQTKLDPELMKYNPGVNFSKGSGLVYIPGRGSLSDFDAMFRSSYINS
ncbi:hypothetical protein S245_022936 [Arachis hypogaea]